jgi:hypothetical protein
VRSRKFSTQIYESENGGAENILHLRMFLTLFELKINSLENTQKFYDGGASLHLKGISVL